MDSVSEYVAGYLTCTSTEAVVAARSAYAKSDAGKSEAAAVENGGPDPERSRHWLSWPVGTPGPSFDQLD